MLFDSVLVYDGYDWEGVSYDLWEEGVVSDGLLADVHGGTATLGPGLLHHVGQGEGRHYSQAGNAEHRARVASVLRALADVGVVLLEDGGVALPGLLLPAAPTDHTLLTTHVLVDLSAVVLPSVVLGAIFEELSRHRDPGVVLVEEGVGTLGLRVAGAYVALDAGSCRQNG